MAKRRKLDLPDPKTLEDLEKGFVAKPGLGAFGAVPPIAQVAADAAVRSDLSDVDQRVQSAQDSKDAEKYRIAMEEGHILQNIPTSAIKADYLTRDRFELDAEAMEELKQSISENGVRLPIEVVLLENDPEYEYGLVSGWRRLAAQKALYHETNEESFLAIKALIRDSKTIASSLVAMVEENEIRAALSPYERGRIAVVSTKQGGFKSVEDAVSILFSAASKAKRSKIRSFALVHEELGDVLNFPTDLSEKLGLDLASALKAGFATKLRNALAENVSLSSEDEQKVLKLALKDLKIKPDISKGGRPQTVNKKQVLRSTIFPNGIKMDVVKISEGRAIQFRGEMVDDEYIETISREIEALFISKN